MFTLTLLLLTACMKVSHPDTALFIDIEIFIILNLKFLYFYNIFVGLLFFFFSLDTAKAKLEAIT